MLHSDTLNHQKHMGVKKRWMLLCLCVLSSIQTIFAQGTANLVLQTTTPQVEVGDVLDVVVAVQSGTQEVDLAEIHLTFDPTILNVTELKIGTTLSSTLIDPTFENNIGTIDYAAGLLANSANGTFDLLTISFEALADGVSEIAFTDPVGVASNIITFVGENVLGTSSTINITVGEGEENKPNIAPIADVILPVGSPINFDVNATDSDGDDISLSLKVIDLPTTDYAFVDNGDGSGQFSWNPSVNHIGSFVARITASDGANDSTIEVLMNLEPLVPGSLLSGICFNANGGAYTSQAGMEFISDAEALEAGYITGGNKFGGNGSNLTFRGTNDDFIYKTERYGGKGGNNLLQLNIPVPNGKYWVVLYFAEFYHGVSNASPVTDSNLRVFDVILEEEIFLEKFDLLNTNAGGLTNSPLTAIIKAKQVDVVDEVVNVVFNAGNEGGVDNGKISAICVIPAEDIDAPTALAISSPTDQANFPEGTEINFAGTAIDSEDGDISAAISWSSSIDGVLGTGASIFGTLSIGNHIITASITDNGGNTVEETVSVAITPAIVNAPPTITGIPDQTHLTGEEVSLDLSLYAIDSDGTIATYNVIEGQLPTGLSLNPTTGAILGIITPEAIANSPYTVGIEVTDDEGAKSDPYATFIWTVEDQLSDDPLIGTPLASVKVTPGKGLGASTFPNNSLFIENLSTEGITITKVSVDLSTAIFPDMVFDPAGDGGDVTAVCLTPNSGAAATGYVSPADPCVTPFSVPRNGGFDVMELNFSAFDPSDVFAFKVDIDPNNIQGVPGAGNAGSVSGLELIGATVTIEFSDGTIAVGNLYEEGSLGGAEVFVPTIGTQPSIAVVGIATTPAEVVNANQTIEVTGTPGEYISLLVLDTRMYIASGSPPFDVTADELPFYANESMAKALYSGQIADNGKLLIPIELLKTVFGNDTPDGGLNYLIAVSSTSLYAVNQPVSGTSNILVLKLGENATPIIDPIADGTYLAETSIQIPINVTDADGDETIISVTMTDQNETEITPEAFVYENTGVNTGLINWTPGLNDGGIYMVTVQADDGNGGIAQISFTLTIQTELVVGTPGALIEITPGKPLGASTYDNNSFQITNQSTGGIQITDVQIDLSTGILPDMVFDPVGSGGDAVSSCFTPNQGAATVGLVGSTGPCVDPFSQAREGGFDILSISFDNFDPNEFFSFTTDIDPNSIQSVPGAGNAGSVSGFELIGATVTITFSDGTILSGNLYEDGSLGGAQVLTPVAGETPTIEVVGVLENPAIVYDENQTIKVSGSSDHYVSILVMDSRLFIASAGPPFNVANADLPFYANQALAKTLLNAQIGSDGTVEVPITLLKTLLGNDTPDGGLNYIIAVTSEEPYGVDKPVSGTSNVLTLKLEEGAFGTPEAIVKVTPSVGLNGSTFNGDAFQIENTSTGNLQIVQVSMDLTTAFLPDMVFDPIGEGGDAVAKCLLPTKGASETGYDVPANNCTGPFSEPRNGGYDKLTIAFSDFNPGEFFAFQTDIDPNSIKGVPGSQNAGSVSGLEITGATITITFNDGSELVGTLFENKTLGGATSILVKDELIPDAPIISAKELITPAIVAEPSQTIVIQGQPNEHYALLQLDTRLYIASDGDPFGVSPEDAPFYANELMSKLVSAGTLPNSGIAEVPVSLLKTEAGTGPQGGKNYFIAIQLDEPYISGQLSPKSLNSNVLLINYDPLLATPANVNPVAAIEASQTTGEAPLTITFNANGSIDEDGIIIQYVWNLGNGNQIQTDGPTLEYTYETPGNYNASLTVIDNKGSKNTNNASLEILANGTVAPEEETITLVSTADTYIDNGNPNVDTNYEGKNIMLARNKSNFGKESLVQFDLSSIDNFDQITKATLRIFGFNQTSTSAVPVSVSGLTDNWKADEVTFNSQPEKDGGSLDEVSYTDVRGYQEFDVTSYVATQTDGIASFTLESVSNDIEIVRMFTSEQGRNVPELVITSVKPSVRKANRSKAEESDVITKAKVDVYPNPVENVLNVQFSSQSSGIIKLEVLDLAGKVLEVNEMEKQGLNHSFKVNTANLPQGVYLLRLQQGSNQLIKRFSKR